MKTRPKPVRMNEEDRAAIRYYEAQTDEEHARELESAEEAGAWILVPSELVGEVRNLIKERGGRKAS